MGLSESTTLWSAAEVVAVVVVATLASKESRAFCCAFEESAGVEDAGAERLPETDCEGTFADDHAPFCEVKNQNAAQATRTIRSIMRKVLLFII